MKYIIIYDYCNPDGIEEHDLVADFEGSWDELQEEIKNMRKDGCYNIDATAEEE